MSYLCFLHIVVFFGGGLCFLFLFLFLFYFGRVLLFNFFPYCVVFNCFVCLHPVSCVQCCLYLWIAPLVFSNVYSFIFVFYSYIFNKTRMKFLMKTLWNWTVGLPDFYLGTNVIHYCIIYIVIKMGFFRRSTIAVYQC
jgi:hypothetical protein